MQCSHCQTENRPGRRFCAECGVPLALPCASCGFANEPGEKFCGGCGASLTAAPRAPEPRVSSPQTYTPAHLAEKILAAGSDLEGERKQVTVLFADIKGSTELIEGLDPEEARKLLDPALHAMMEAVHRYEGTVNQVLGDGIMALFGAPIAHEDHAVRACYAALAMQAAMRRYGEAVRHAHGLEVQTRVGLNSGEVVVRAIGNDLHMDYSAVGQTTHLAARMEQLATPGSIRLTAATLRLVEGLVQVNALGRFPVKGLSEPVEVFELSGASTVRRRLQASAARGLTRFVGRQTEIEALGSTQERAGAGHGQVVAIVGEAGVGKSRLVYEFVHSHRTRDWLVLESTSVSYGKATPYFPVIDLLKRYAHVEEHDDTRTIRAKVTGQVLTLDETLQDSISALLALLDALPEDSPFLRLDPPQRRQRTLAALKRVLLRESQRQPLLLVFEDLHWIDAETQALLDSLVESLPTARLLLLVNYRPEYQHGWGSKTYYTQLRLDPLPPVSAEELLRAREALASFEQALVALQHLPDRRDIHEQAIDLRLDLYSSLFMLGEHRQTLVHLREAETLATALGDQRRLGHVSAWMSNTLLVTGDNDRALASGQCALALTTALGDLPLVALSNSRLGHVYHILGDYQRAMDLLRQAVEALPGEPSRDRVGERVGAASLLSVISRTFLLGSLAEVGEFTEGVARGEEGVRIAEATEHLTSLITVYYGMGRLFLRQGDVHKAVSVLERGLSLCETCKISTSFIMTAAPLGYAYVLSGRVAEALPLLAQVLEEADRSGFIYSYALYVAWLSEAYLLADRKEDALALAQRALARSRAHKERGHQAYALRLLGEIAAQRYPPDVPYAEAHYQHALALTKELGMRPLQAHCHRGLGTLYATAGRREQARAELSMAIELYRAMDMTFWLSPAEAALVQVSGAGVAGQA